MSLSPTWTSYRLVPDDLLFFRDGKPSTIGEDHFLHSIFPLLPSTLYGAVRTARLVEEGHDLRKLGAKAWADFPAALREELGEWGGLGALELRGPWLVQGNAPLFPAPADLGVTTTAATTGKALPSSSKSVGGKCSPERTVTSVVRFRPDPVSSTGAWSHPYRTMRPYTREGEVWVSTRDDAPESSAGWFLTTAGIVHWLRGELPSLDDFVHSSALWRTEIRSGVGLETSSRTAKKGSLYTVGFIRLCHDVSIGFELRNGALACPGRLRLGGDGKTARIEAGNSPNIPAPVSLNGGPTAHTVYLATPAFSREGSSPPEGVKGTFAAVVRASSLAGGWNLAKGESKPLRRAIPAGSVYFVEHDPTNAIQQQHGTNISDTLDDPAPLQGFGLAFVGRSN